MLWFYFDRLRFYDVSVVSFLPGWLSTAPFDGRGYIFAASTLYRAAIRPRFESFSSDSECAPCMINLCLLARPSRVASSMAQFIFEVR